MEKTSNNDRGSNSAAQTSTTSDKVWLLSLKEIAGSSVVDAYRDSGPWLGEEGAQYEYFRTYFQSASDRPEELCRTMCIYYDKTMPEGSRGMWFRLRSPMANNDIRWYTATQAGRADAFAYAYLMYAITPGWSMGEAN